MNGLLKVYGFTRGVNETTEETLRISLHTTMSIQTMRNLTIYSENGIRWIISHGHPDKIVGLLKKIVSACPTNHADSRMSSPRAHQTKPDKGSLSTSQIKSNPVRTVYRLTIDNGQSDDEYTQDQKRYTTGNHEIFYLKHYKAKGWGDLIKYTFFGSKARREWLNGHKILKMGIITGEPIAYGEKRHIGLISDNFLLVRAISHGKPLPEVLSNDLSRDPVNLKEKRIFMERLASFILDLHSKGILHKDLHSGNIMVIPHGADPTHHPIPSVSLRINPENEGQRSHPEQGNGSDTRFCLIDLHSVRCKGRLSTGLKHKNLAFQLYSMTLHCSRTEILRVLKAYIKGANIKNNGEKRIIERINGLINKIRQRHLLSRTKRCLKDSSSFTIQGWDNYKAHLRRGYDVQWIKEAINIHCTARGSNPGFIIKDTRKVFITSFPLSGKAAASSLNNTTGRICVKEYRNLGIVRQLRRLIFPSRARKAWFAANGFIVRGLSTPLPIALLERRRVGLLTSSLLITEYLEDTTPVPMYVSNTFGDNLRPHTRDDFIKKRGFIESLARSFKILHRADIYHADLKGGNILVKEENKAEWAFYYLDLDRVAITQRLTQQRIIKNLSQLNASLPNAFSLSDRMRFFKAYTGMGRLTVDDKALVRKIVAKSIKRNHLWRPRHVKPTRPD